MGLSLVLGHQAKPLLPNTACSVLCSDSGMAGELLTPNPQTFRSPGSLSPESWPCHLFTMWPRGKSLSIRLVRCIHHWGH